MTGTTKNGELARVEEMVAEKKVKYMSPGECRSHMRRTLAKEFQSIVNGFVEAAKKGSCPHVKLATELLKPIRKNPSRKKGTVAKYIEQLDREKLERERLQKERLATEHVQS
jgi:UDP-N-acetylmuramoylalanine-D-glutamate ligase